MNPRKDSRAMLKTLSRFFFAASPTLVLAVVAAAQAPQRTAAVKVDSETISGLGARNIGSAAMSGRIAALDAVQEGNRLTVYVGTASGGVFSSRLCEK